jgi:hypothetical protein
MKLHRVFEYRQITNDSNGTVVILASGAAALATSTPPPMAWTKVNVNGSLRILRNANTDDGIAFPVPEKVDILVGSVSSLNTLYGGSPSCYFLFPANVR